MSEKTITTKRGPVDEGVHYLTRQPNFIAALAKNLELESGGEDISEFVIDALEKSADDFYLQAKLNRAALLERQAAKLRSEANA